MKWATRAGIHIDRAACAWLIRRELDPRAEFVFVTDPAAVPADATPFDMPGVELSHHEGDCSFETILRRYQLVDPVLWTIAEIIHEADLDDERYDAPEAPGFDVALRALAIDLHRRRGPRPHRSPVRWPLRVLPPRHIARSRAGLTRAGASCSRPQHASWLNQVEMFFSVLARRLLRHGQHSDPEDLALQMLAFVEHYNPTPSRFAGPTPANRSQHETRN